MSLVKSQNYYLLDGREEAAKETGAFGKTSAMLKLTQENSLNKNAVYERILKSADWLQWLCQNLCRKKGFLAPLPQWLENRRVCLVDESDESKPGRKGADYRLHYLVELFQLSIIEMHLTSEKEGENISKNERKQIKLFNFF